MLALMSSIPQNTNESDIMEELAPLLKCIAFTGLRPNELILGVPPSERHEHLLASYKFAEMCGGEDMHSALVDDIRAALANFTFNHAADLLIVLRKVLGARSQPAQCLAATEPPFHLSR
jgi:hypothetical protein